VPLNNYNEKELLACAAGLEIHSQHPLAQGILNKTRELGITVSLPLISNLLLEKVFKVTALSVKVYLISATSPLWRMKLKLMIKFEN
jgi:Cu2+-exporting ATPase